MVQGPGWKCFVGEPAPLAERLTNAMREFTTEIKEHTEKKTLERFSIEDGATCDGEAGRFVYAL